jgi:hypothetical protein
MARETSQKDPRMILPHYDLQGRELPYHPVRLLRGCIKASMTFLNSEKLLFEKPPSPLKDVALLVRLLRTQVPQEKLGGTMAATVIPEARKKSQLSLVILLVIPLVQQQDVMILISDCAPSETIA